MKTVKFILSIIFVGIIGITIYNWDVIIKKIINTPRPGNPFIEKIEKEINSLNKLPSNVFCVQEYKNIQASIDEFYRNGSLGLTSYKEGNIWKEGKNDTSNKEWQKILSKNLYTAYAPKFVEQAMYVFSRSEWKNDDLKFIRSEVKNLKSSAYLGSTGLVASFDEINTILAKYDELNNFINACKGYKYSNYNLENTYSDVSHMIIKSRAYIKNNLDNSYVNNCTRLKDGLKAIPKIHFDKHISYLTKKVNDNGPKYRDFVNQPAYSTSIYTPLRRQLDALNNDIYGISVNAFENGYNSVYNLLSGYNRAATDYFNK